MFKVKHTCIYHANLTLNKCCQGQIIKKVSEKLPHIGIAILPQAFIIKPVPGTKICYQ